MNLTDPLGILRKIQIEVWDKDIIGDDDLRQLVLAKATDNINFFAKWLFLLHMIRLSTPCLPVPSLPVPSLPGPSLPVPSLPHPPTPATTSLFYYRRFWSVPFIASTT